MLSGFFTLSLKNSTHIRNSLKCITTKSLREFWKICRQLKNTNRVCEGVYVCIFLRWLPKTQTSNCSSGFLFFFFFFFVQLLLPDNDDNNSQYSTTIREKHVIENNNKNICGIITIHINTSRLIKLITAKITPCRRNSDFFFGRTCSLYAIYCYFFFTSAFCTRKKNTN